ncbi:oligopeptide ABC transporter, periplasmic oligopeptide-binding protein OppA [Geomicrobium sp. JCM 19037]|uniref:glutathione ABC transporter substrate-binding protein n=1 Tax=unclassified Geomicrobium TaxID=2628951 RepID=UPI00045F2AB8|nr:glutathione ABC transporter substrate-binding protein [Geomicrobium sp. JCM 19037]GAK04877.1 oligopeptide ABC transporter, periplasmic oligopeptide-binding protein OppA [Geomicrobium sp. JCM 19037]
MTSKKHLFAGIAGTAVLLAGCTSDPGDVDESAAGSDDQGEVASGDNFVMAVSSDIDTLDPHFATDVPSSQVTTNIYETLVEHDENMEVVPALAESFEIIDDLTWEFNIREGVTFHDGEPLDAEAVVTSFDRLFDPDELKPRANMFELVEDVIAVDDYTVHFELSEPFASLDDHLTHSAAAIISPQAIEDHNNGDLLLGTEAYGTGPFQLEHWEQGNAIDLGKNDDYWGDEPQVSTVSFNVVPEQSTRMGMLDQGEVHFIDQIEPANAASVDNINGASLLSQEQLGFQSIAFNTEVEPFDDPDVRRALAMAIDREAIVEGLYSGYGQVAKGPLSPITFGYSEDTEAIEHDLDAAADLLAEAGYEDGFSATLYTNDENHSRIQLAEVAQDYFGQIGVDISIEMMEWGTYLEAMNSGNTEIFISGWSTVTADADYAMHPNFHSDNLGSEGNNSFYVNEEVDELLDEARRETDDEVREDLYAQAEQIIINDAPQIFTVHNDYITGISDSVDGFVLQNNGIYDFSNVSISGDAGGY